METDFGDILVEWYEANKRDLPWRGTDDPYRIWISEIILQQTRVAQGYDYFTRFVERFPDVESLAAAEEDEVMRLWQGLGYYSRARNLHEAARQVVALGGFPQTFRGVRALKGVGDYTAAAICSFAFGLPCAVVDGNVYRVLSRWLGIDTPIDSREGAKRFAAVAGELLDKSRPGLYNQAIMEFGALQCVPSSPDCTACPLAGGCAAWERGLVEALPVKQHKAKVSDRYFHYIYVRVGACTYIKKRTNRDIWRNLYEFPLVESEREWTEGEFYASEALRQLFPGETAFRCVRRGVRHVLSHRVIHADFYEARLPEEGDFLPDYLRVPVAELSRYAMPRLLCRFLEEL